MGGIYFFGRKKKVSPTLCDNRVVSDRPAQCEIVSADISKSGRRRDTSSDNTQTQGDHELWSKNYKKEGCP